MPIVEERPSIKVVNTLKLYGSKIPLIYPKPQEIFSTKMKKKNKTLDQSKPLFSLIASKTSVQLMREREGDD